MHSKRLRRRRLHAERAPERRDIVESEFGGNGGNFVNVPVGGFTLTGPITLTIISTLPSSSTTTTSTSASSTVQTITTSSTSTTPLTTSNVTSQTPLTSPSSFSPASTPVPSVILPPMTSTGVSEQMNANSDLSTTKVPAGGIAGIVIGCLVLLGLVLFFLLRARSRRSRRKLRNTWTRNGPVGISSTSFEPKPFVGDAVPPNTSPEMRFAPPTTPRPFQSDPLSVTIPSANAMPMPPATYNNGDDIPQSALSPRASRVLSPTSVYSPTSAALSPSSATVVCTFIVSLPDELAIKVGETVRVLAEYDDGWALCMNASGEQGMVPIECLSRSPLAVVGSLGPSGLLPPMLDRDGRGTRRISSLGPSARS
ncbi:hypothetical protein CVT26_011046 [Gymnopilus dilepis]|uniref:SH3 domain-containing protein n=1 Tax=Gymnopilus dilepis TaxID=231916 RepID=A0A409VIV5_9AGAR|nr:hypothetical protein CVT26_011046 [Gymnopilus dilepis]